jgi:tetratricopeptide (TPR) repeat protein
MTPEQLKRHRAAWLTLLCAMPVLAAFIILTRLRNEDYSNESRMWRNVLEQRSDNPRALNMTGVEYMDSGDLDNAERLFKKANRINPNNLNPIFNLGLLFSERSEGAKNTAERDENARYAITCFEHCRGWLKMDSIIEHNIAVLKNRLSIQGMEGARGDNAGPGVRGADK